MTSASVPVSGPGRAADPARPVRPSRLIDKPVAGTTVRLPQVRKVIGARMMESLHNTAQLTAVQEADLTTLAEYRTSVKGQFLATEGFALTFQPFLAYATVQALKEYPEFNASISGDGRTVTYHSGIHLGIAVDTPRGLMVPVVRNTEQHSFIELARGVADVVARTRDNTIEFDELSGSTFTLSNIGSAGSITDTPIINPPEVAILALGAIRRMPRVIRSAHGEEMLAIRSVCSLPLTYDHRLIDGAAAGRFLESVRAHLEIDSPAVYFDALASAGAR